jgi:transposase
VRDDRPFAGPDPPAAAFFYSRNRGEEHPDRHLAGYPGILQADAYAGFGDLYDGKRKPGPITSRTSGLVREASWARRQASSNSSSAVTLRRGVFMIPT